MKIDSFELTRNIKLKALDLGFSACGVARAGHLDEDASHLSEWLSERMHAGMAYMQNHFDKRVNPQLLFPNARSVIVILLNYYPSGRMNDRNNLILSKYAYGNDYHAIVKKRLKSLQSFINQQVPQSQSRICVDTAPILERAWAAKAGLGWIGKNANLIAQDHGSFVFIGEIITDIDLLYDTPSKDRCGTCIKCVLSCPAGAIVSPRKIDSNRCISYWTIENKGPITESLKNKIGHRIFGCDICQDVCPWNQNAKANNIPEFQPSRDLLLMRRSDWINLNEDHYNKLFKKSAVKRTSYKGLKRNIAFSAE
jgi:epoxyqueuosine reductase